MIGRAVLLLAVVGAALTLAAGTALAATIQCTSGEQFCNGTNQNDTIRGSEATDTIFVGGGDDAVDCAGGNDSINGDDGNDKISGGSGDDSIDAVDGKRNYISCGPGTDEAEFDAGIDVVSPDCEKRFPF